MDEHLMQKKIYYHDTDCGGVVYYANYLKYLEEARTEWLAARGIDLRFWGEKGVWFVVTSVDIKYKSPAHYQETITVRTRVEKVTPARIVFFQEVLRQDGSLVEALTTLGCIDSGFKPKQIPPEIKRVL